MRAKGLFNNLISIFLTLIFVSIFAGSALSAVPTAIAKNSYDFEWASQSDYVVLDPGQETTLNLKIRNIGTTIWDKNIVHLGTAAPLDRTSIFYNQSWLTQNRAAGSVQDKINPQEIADFNIKIIAPNTPGQHKEYFQPVADGVSWMKDIGIYWIITVNESGMTAAIENKPLDISLPFETKSSWSGGYIDSPQISYMVASVNNDNRLFATKDGAFVADPVKGDTWFVYGLFGAINAINDPNNPKYGIWGSRHDGIDFAAPVGTNIVSSAEGQVVFVGDYIGTTIIIKCQDMYITYGHLNKTFKKVGEIAKKGELIGEVGNSGNITNPHLHFELDKKISGNKFYAINPIKFFNRDEMVIPNFAANSYLDPAGDQDFEWTNPYNII